MAVRASAEIGDLRRLAMILPGWRADEYTIFDWEDKDRWLCEVEDWSCLGVKGLA